MTLYLAIFLPRCFSGVISIGSIYRVSCSRVLFSRYFCPIFICSFNCARNCYIIFITRFNNGTASIQGYDNAIGLLGWQGVYVEGPLNAGNVRTRGSFSFNSGGTFSSGDLTYLHWLNSNWGEVTPNEEWVAGLDTARFVWNEEVTSKYIKSSNKYNVTISGTIKGTNKNGVEISTEKYPRATYTIDATEAYDAGRAAGSSSSKNGQVYCEVGNLNNSRVSIKVRINGGGGWGTPIDQMVPLNGSSTTEWF